MNLNEKIYQQFTKRPSSDDINSTDQIGTNTLIKVKTDVLAKQITHIELKYFKAIPPNEFRSLNWNSPNIRNYIDWSNQLHNWVVTEIIKEEKPAGKIEILRKFLAIIQKLEEMHNYSSILAIFNGTQSESVYRLDLSKQLSPSEIKQYEYYTNLLKPDCNWKNLREVIRNSDFNCLPFLGIYMKDLTYSGELKDIKRKSLNRVNSSLPLLGDSRRSNNGFIPSNGFNRDYRNNNRESRIDKIVEEISKYNIDCNFPIFKTVQENLHNLSKCNQRETAIHKSNAISGSMSNLEDAKKNFAHSISNKNYEHNGYYRTHQRSGSYNPPSLNIIMNSSSDESRSSETNIPKNNQFEQLSIVDSRVQPHVRGNSSRFYGKTSFQLSTNCHSQDPNDEEKTEFIYHF